MLESSYSCVLELQDHAIMNQMTEISPNWCYLVLKELNYKKIKCYVDKNNYIILAHPHIFSLIVGLIDG